MLREASGEAAVYRISSWFGLVRYAAAGRGREDEEVAAKQIPTKTVGIVLDSAQLPVVLLIAGRRCSCANILKDERLSFGTTIRIGRSVVQKIIFVIARLLLWRAILVIGVALKIGSNVLVLKEFVVLFAIVGGITDHGRRSAIRSDACVSASVNIVKWRMN